MAPTVIKLHVPRFRRKILMLDYDHTLVRPTGNHPFPKNVDDWQWLDPCIPGVIKSQYKKGYMILICTQQSKSWKLDQIRKVLEPLDIPMFISVATEKADYKPSRVIFDAVVSGTQQDKWDRAASLMVGDALGRRGDWSDCDRMFAEALGVAWKSPEDFFGIASA